MSLQLSADTRPASNPRFFRETVQIAAASIILNVLVLVPFWLVHSLWAHGTPNIGAMISMPHAYWIAHYRLVAGWAFLLFIAACLIGFLAGASLVPPRRSERPRGWGCSRSIRRIRNGSVWS